MKTKSHFLPKIMTISVGAFLFLTSTAFVDNEKEINTEGLDYYFFLEYTPGSTSDYSKTRYISSFIYYSGYDDCGNSYDFEPKAKRAFENHIKANYDESSVRHTQTYSQQLNSTNKIKSTQQASEVLDKYLADQKAKGRNVIKTSFSYSCE